MSITTLAILVVAALLILIGLYMMVKSNNLIRMILALEVAMKAVTLLIAFAGKINGNTAVAQSFIVTLIVAEVAVAVVAAGLAISIYRKNGSIELSKLNKLKG